MKKYKKSVSREGSSFDLKAWHEGESQELRKKIGFGFDSHIFVCKSNVITIYYSLEEAEKFEAWMEENFTEIFFNELCDEFVDLVDKIPEVNSNEEVFKLSVKMWPALLFFDELSKYPEWGNDSMIRRLMRLRTSTEASHYELSQKAKHEYSDKDYIFFKGQIYHQDFDSFCRENEVEVIS